MFSQSSERLGIARIDPIPAEGVQGTIGSRSMLLCSLQTAQSSLGAVSLLLTFNLLFCFPKLWSSVTKNCLMGMAGGCRGHLGAD